MTTTTTAELIQAVRDCVDEDNTSDLSNDKILGALNRAQLQLTRIAGKHFPEMLKRTLVTSTYTGRSIQIPSGSAAFTVNQVDAIFDQ